MMITYFLLPLAAAGLSQDRRTFAHPQPETRISNGRNMEITDAPWMVSLQVLGHHHCGATIYSDRIIITAANCFYLKLGVNVYRRVHTKEFLVVAGSKFKSSRDNIAAVSQAWHHEKFTIKPLNIEYDIGIMRVRKPLPTGRHVKPIPLALANPQPGSRVLSTGWGLMIGQPAQYILPEVLQGANLSVLPASYCQQSRIGYTICAGAGYSGCKRDAGGPLVFQNTLVGILSGGPSMCIGPVIFTSVAHFNKWLTHVAGTILLNKKT